MRELRIPDDVASILLGRDRSVSVAATGAGAGLQKALWDVPGISRILHSAEFPYATEALDRYLGYSPSKYCSKETAVAMSMEAYRRAWAPGVQTVGVGITGSVASSSEHRGDHRVFIATFSDEACHVDSLKLFKGSGRHARETDGAVTDAFGLTAIFSAAGVPYRPDVPAPVEEFSSEPALDVCEALLSERPFFSRGKRMPAPSGGLTIFPGAFNPPHPGHLWLGDSTGAIFHICVRPPHKPPLPPVEVLRRAKLLDGRDVFFSSGDPLYIDKARRHPGCKIVIGADAFVRMLDPSWGHPVEPMIREFAELGAHLFVADRVHGGKLVTLPDVWQPFMAGVCSRIVTPVEHVDLSSTAVRGATALT